MHIPNNRDIGVELGSSLPDSTHHKSPKSANRTSTWSPMQSVVVPLEENQLCEPLEGIHRADAILLAWVILLDRYNGGSELSFSWGSSPAYTTSCMSTADVHLTGELPVCEVIKRVHAFRMSHCPVGDDMSGSQPHLYITLDDTAKTGTSHTRKHNGVDGILADISTGYISVSFPHWTPQFQVNAFREVLGDLLSDLRRPLSSVLLPTKHDMATIWSWNASLPPTIRRCMHELIAERAAMSPDAPAVHAWDGDLTYRQLDTLSDTLACLLVSHGVGTGTLVPLCFEKSLYAVVTVLAVLKAGGGFVFLSPTQPLERLKTIMGEIGGDLIVSSEKQAGLALDIASTARNFIVSQAVLADSSPPPTSPPLPSPDPESILYVIFTSGSTGKPKGVEISHSNYTSGAILRAEAVGYRPTSRVLDFAAYVFDVSIDCILCTLACGGCVCIPSEEDRMNSLSSVIRKLHVNMAHMTPSVARVLDSDVLASLDVLGLGGEAVPAKDAVAWNQKTKVVVAYGPSECTVGCTINNDVGGDLTPYASIGKGVGGITWIVDPEDYNRLMPLGEVGELLVEGPIVGQGYLGRPELTEQVFVKDPSWLIAGHGAIPGRKGRLYKTGDLVSYSLDGSGRINFVARKDQQVKIRGQRVELVEIECHLRENLPDNTSVAVEVITPVGTGSEQVLVAFLSEAQSQPDENRPRMGGESLLVSFSREFDKTLMEANNILASRLPVYMVPSAYIPLAKIPTLVSCKTDRKRLREIGASMTRSQLAKIRGPPPTSPNTQTHPETQKEILLGHLWTQVIGPHVDATKNDNFFFMGGDSLKAMRLVAAARKAGMTLTVSDVFINPCLAPMANVATIGKESPHLNMTEPEPFSLLPLCWDTTALKADVATLCHLDPHEIDDIYPCTPLQEGLMALSAKTRDAYVAQRVVKLQDSSVAFKLRGAFDITSADSPILNTRIVQIPFKGLLQVITKGSIQWRSGTNLKKYLEDDREDPMELGTALVRYAVITDPQTRAVHFVLTIHHALYDGWSMQLVVERVNKAYHGVRLPRPTSFKSFIKYLGSQDQLASERYWREYLRGADGPQFPTHPHQGYQTKADSLLERYIKVPHSQTIVNTTLATAIRAAWAVTAAKELGISDVVFGETLTGRNAPIPGVEGIEGPMITTVPVRVHVADDMSISDFLRDIHQQAISRIPHENFGLQNIRRLGLDAREACDLKTGLVLHPVEEDEVDENEENDEPANGFVPVDDAEAAREALKFNTYALMLVCSLDATGFLVMASFDSRTVEVGHVERLLRHMDAVVKALLHENGSRKLGDIDVMDDEDASRAWKVGVRAVLSNEDMQQCNLPNEATVDAAWVMNPNDAQQLLPVGAVGEVVVECLHMLALDRIDAPRWFAARRGEDAVRKVQLYKTGNLGKYNQNGQLAIVGSTASWAAHTVKNGPSKTKELATAPEKGNASTPAQRQLLQLWSRAVYLSEADIDPNDSFFALGGDSIGAMKLVSEARHLGLELSVADIFKHKTLAALEEKVVKRIHVATNAARVATPPATPEATRTTDSGYGSPVATHSLPSSSTIAVPATTGAFGTLISDMLQRIVRPQLRCGPSPVEIMDVLPTRPLQDIAIQGTIQNPKFSVRYEMLHFSGGPVDSERLRSACRDLVSQNEILRTVFVSQAWDKRRPQPAEYLAVVLKRLDVPFDSFELSAGEGDNDVAGFAKMWCNLDVQTAQPLGSSFVKFMLVIGGTSGKATLVFRISHAQYDEMALPGLLAQLAALYSRTATKSTPSFSPGVPFSTLVAHTTDMIHAGGSMKYWRELLKGAEWCSLPWPKHPGKEARQHYAVEKSFEIATHPGVTLATLPTAAWALVLARATGKHDVMFGEVVSGRSTGLHGAEMVVGPAWQYVPVRIKLIKGMTGTELLEEVQRQHGESAAHECVSLREMVRDGAVAGWTPPWEGKDGSSIEEQEPWFPTVVHQAIVVPGGVEFGKANGDGGCVKAEMETLYLHQEPLREWKTQAFVEERGKKMTLEIVTFDGWREYADEVLKQLGNVFESLVKRPGEVVWE